MRVPIRSDSLPLFARGGATVVSQSMVRHTGESPATRILTFLPGPARSTTIIEDDGITHRGPRCTRTIRYRRTRDSLAIEWSHPRGRFRPPSRDLLLRVWIDERVREVELDGQSLGRRRRLTVGREGFMATSRWIELRTADLLQPRRAVLRFR